MLGGYPTNCKKSFLVFHSSIVVDKAVYTRNDKKKRTLG